MSIIGRACNLSPTRDSHCSQNLLAAGIGFTIILLFLFVVLPEVGAGDRISCFIIGTVDPAINPFTAFFRIDPLFTYSVEPLPPDLSNPEKQRLDKIYYPRTGRSLIEYYDLMVFRTARITHFTSRQLNDLDTAFREGAMTAISSFSLEWDSVWITSVLYDIVPVSEYYKDAKGLPYKVRFRREREPVFLPLIDLGLEDAMGVDFHVMEPKQGSTIWADLVPYGLPWLVSWRPGGGDPGMQWVFPGAFDVQWFGETNPYAIDFATNLILHSLGRPLIRDIHARREARQLISAVKTQKVVVLDMADWADSFGADTTQLIEDLYMIEEDAEEAITQYLDRDYPAAITGMRAIFERISIVAEDAVDLKNRTMFWVFISEWLIITSVGIISGALLWSLMVKRRVYREIRSTRLKQI